MAVIDKILEFNSKRDQLIIPFKLGAMAENAFRFYRGTCHLFHEDLSMQQKLPAFPIVWASGDLHLENFGSFKSDNRQVYFDLNDFDEAALAPASWEITRLVTSIYVAFASLDIGEERADKMAALYLRSYSKALQNGKPDYIESRTANGIVCEFLKRADRKKLRNMLPKRTYQGKRQLLIDLAHPKHLKLDRELRASIIDHMNAWLKKDEYSPYNYTVIDACFRLAGTGSLGVSRYELLLESSNDVGERYILLDMKEAVQPTLSLYRRLQPVWTTEAERVVNIQRRMQNRPPALLSSTVFNDRSYIVQEMQPEKDSMNFKLLQERYRDMYQVVNDLGVLTAASQLRSSGRQGSSVADELIAFGENNGWMTEVLAYSRDYAGKVKDQYLQFKEAVPQAMSAV